MKVILCVASFVIVDIRTEIKYYFAMMQGTLFRKKYMTAKRCPGWSSSYDAHQDWERPRFDPPLRYRFFSDPQSSLNRLLHISGGKH